jgi:hypothetical protein
LQSQVFGKGKLVLCPVFGTFLPSSSYIKFNNVIPEESGENAAANLNGGGITRDNLNKLENT